MKGVRPYHHPPMWANPIFTTSFEENFNEVTWTPFEPENLLWAISQFQERVCFYVHVISLFTTAATTALKVGRPCFFARAPQGAWALSLLLHRFSDHSYLMLRYYFLSCTWIRGGGLWCTKVLKQKHSCFCYVSGSSLALAHRLDATLLDFLLHLHTDLMLRC